MELVDRGGFSIAYSLRGEGAPLVFLSGLGLDSAPLKRAAASIQDRFQCILIDNRGTGGSGTSTEDFTIDDLADDVIAVLDQLQLARVSAIGWSMGGTILQSLLHRYPDRIDHAVLLSTLPRYTPVQHAWLDGTRAIRRSEYSLVDQALFNQAWSFTPRLLADHQGALALAEITAASRGAADNAAYEQQAAAIRAFDALDSLNGVTADVLVLVGAEDILTPVEQAVQIADAIPGAQLRVLPRGGHGMVLEYPDDTLTAIREFLEG